jgi:hypothetical protein
MLRRVLATVPCLGLVAAVFASPSVGASSGTLTLDHRTGVVTWSAVVSCNDGDDVQFVVLLTQSSREATAVETFTCEGSHHEVLATTTIDGENDRLRPGPTDIHVIRTDTPMDEWGEPGEPEMSEARSQVKLSPHGV